MASNLTKRVHPDHITTAPLVSLPTSQPSLEKKMEELRRSTFTDATSFGRIGYAVSNSPITELEISVDDDDLLMNDFEFSFKLVESDPGALTKTIAGEIISDIRALPVYPVFNRNLFAGGFESSLDQEFVERMSRLALPFEEHDLRSASVSSSSSISSEAGDPAVYCVWTPKSSPQSPDRWRMNQTTGSASSEFRRFRLRDLFVGRSRSDAKEKFMVFRAAEKDMERSGFCPILSRRAMNSKGGEVKEMDVITAHWLYYGKGAAVTRRSFLPYRLELLGGFIGRGERPPSRLV